MMIFVSLENFSGLRVEGTTYMFESDESHGIFYPIIVDHKLNSIAIT